MSSEVHTVDVDTGAEKGVKLERFDLIPAAPFEAVARHYGVGAKKYADRNWERGYAWSKSFGAMMRHAWAFWRGEDIDEETGSHHLAAVVFHAFALMEYGKTHPEKDDRPYTEQTIDIVKRLNDAMGHVPSQASAVHDCETCHYLPVAGSDEPCLSCCMWNSLPNWEVR